MSNSDPCLSLQSPIIERVRKLLSIVYSVFATWLSTSAAETSSGAAKALGSVNITEQRMHFQYEVACQAPLGNRVLTGEYCV